MDLNACVILHPLSSLELSILDSGDYTPIGADLAVVGMKEKGIYIARRHNTVTHYIENIPIIDFCLSEEWKPGQRLYRRW